MEPSTVYDERTLLSLLALDLKFKRLVEAAQEAKMEESVVRDALDKVTLDLVRMCEANPGLREQCTIFLEQVHSHFQVVCLAYGVVPVTETAQDRMSRIEAQEQADRRSNRPRSRSWCGVGEMPSRPRTSAIRVDVEGVTLLTDDEDIVKRSLVMLEAGYRVASQKGVRLWKQQEMTAAYNELMKAERISMKLQTLRQQIAIEQALQDIKAGPEGLCHQLQKKKKRCVRFSEEISEVVGFADEDVDRRPIEVTPSSTLETLLIRSFRQFPSLSRTDLDMGCAIPAR